MSPGKTGMPQMLPHVDELSFKKVQEPRMNKTPTKYRVNSNI